MTHSMKEMWPGGGSPTGKQTIKPRRATMHGRPSVLGGVPGVQPIGSQMGTQTNSETSLQGVTAGHQGRWGEGSLSPPCAPTGWTPAPTAWGSSRPSQGKGGVGDPGLELAGRDLCGKRVLLTLLPPPTCSLQRPLREPCVLPAPHPARPESVTLRSAPVGTAQVQGVPWTRPLGSPVPVRGDPFDPRTLSCVLSLFG